jgi:hypothetical protein
MTPSPLRLLAVTLLGVCLGFFTPILISFLFLVWYDAWWRRHEVEAHLSAAMPSPAEAGDVERDEAWIDEAIDRALKR